MIEKQRQNAIILKKSPQFTSLKLNFNSDFKCKLNSVYIQIYIQLNFKQKVKD